MIANCFSEATICRRSGWPAVVLLYPSVSFCKNGKEFLSSLLTCDEVWAWEWPCLYYVERDRPSSEKKILRTKMPRNNKTSQTGEDYPLKYPTTMIGYNRGKVTHYLRARTLVFDLVWISVRTSLQKTIISCITHLIVLIRVDCKRISIVWSSVSLI